MFLSHLHLINFKNYTEQEVNFAEKMNCFVGNNGAGKTNLLDAIYYLSFCKSYFNFVDNQNIRHGEDFFALHGDYVFRDNDNESKQERYSCIQQHGKAKQVRFGKKNYERFSDHIGKIPLVIISPYDQDLINGGSDLRRKFLDGMISQVDKTYLDLLINYQKVLEQRNKLLKQFYENRYFDQNSLEIWDEQLVRTGEPIQEIRINFLKRFAEYFQKNFALISSSEEIPSIEYSASFTPEMFQTALTEVQKKDAILQYTSVGIHKDELVFNINGHSVKKIASQGQQKTFLLALKLAQFEYILDSLQQKPLLMLDDVFDKLDLDRVRHLLKLVTSERFGQVFLTDTQQNRVKVLLKENDIACKMFSVKGNSIISESDKF